MYEIKFDRLDNIIDRTIDSIKKSVDEIKEISVFAKKEYMDLEDEFLRLKIEATDLIDRVEELENKYKISKTKLLLVNKNYDDYSENQMRIIYEETDNLRVAVAVEKEREINLIQRRNKLELHLKQIGRISEKADKLSNDFDTAYSVLSGDLKEITEKIGDIENKEILGLKIIEAQEIERQRMAREMHDGPAQSLSNLVIKTEICIKLIDKDIERTKVELQVLKQHIRSTIAETRRMIYNLRPMSIDDLGLIPTMDRLIEKISSKLGYDINYSVINKVGIKERDVDPLITLTLYRMTQEALNNIVKYSKATAVEVNLSFQSERIVLDITDNGIGFIVDSIKLNMDNSKGFGVSMMRERANLLNGELKIVSEENKGTSIHIKVPLVVKEEKNG